MINTKKLFVLIGIFIISFGTFFNSYKNVNFVYAENEVQWQDCNTKELQTQAFLAYCKSNDLTIEGSAADVLTSFTTQTYQNVLRAVGLNINSIQSDIKYATDSNGGLKFLFTSNGATAMNRVFSQFLQDNEIAVGDNISQNDPKTLYSGSYYVDPDGNACLVTIMGANATSKPVAIGSPYIYDEYSLQSLVTSSYTSTPFTWTVKYYDTSGNISAYTYEQYYYSSSYAWIKSNKPNGQAFNYLSYHASKSTNKVTQRGYPSIIRIPNGTNAGLYLGFYTYPLETNYNYSIFYDNKIGNASDVSPATVIVYAPTVNNNDYSQNTYTTINNNGDVNNYDGNDEPPVDDPSDDPTTPAEDWDIDMPDLGIDWILQGKEDKFPWDIPFNVMLALSLLNAEPETPHLEGTINFGFTSYDYELDLHQFDSVAEICRNLEFLAFLIGLMLLTKKLIWG